MVLAWRKTGGSCCSVWSKATLRLAIAWKALVALEIALVSCVLRPAIAVESFAVLTTKRSKRCSSEFSSPTKALVRLRPGPKYL